MGWVLQASGTSVLLQLTCPWLMALASCFNKPAPGLWHQCRASTNLPLAHGTSFLLQLTCPWLMTPAFCLTNLPLAYGTSVLLQLNCPRVSLPT
eukprot:1155652-Pelagomonas_calceolata.AAC.7